MGMQFREMQYRVLQCRGCSVWDCGVVVVMKWIAV